MSRPVLLGVALATVDALWLAPWWQWLAAFGSSGPPPPLGLPVMTAAGAALVARGLGASRLGAGGIQVVALAGAGLAVLTGVWWVAGPPAGPGPESWAGTLLAVVVAALAWWRGLHYGGQTPSSATARRSAGTAVLAFAAVAALATVTHPIALAAPILAAAAAALVALALARQEESARGFGGTLVELGPTWVGLLGVSVGGVLLVAAGLTALLPLSTARVLAGALWPPPPLVARAILAVVEVVFNIVFAIVLWLLTLLTGSGEPFAPRPEVLQELPLEPPGAGRLLSPWLLVAVRLGILAVVLLVLAVLVARALRRRLARPAAGSPAEHETLFSVGRLTGDLGAALRVAWQAVGVAARRWSPRPAGGVRRLYAELLRLMAAQGRGRRPAQTPYEYRPVPEAALPDVAGEVRALTDAYVRVRYGERLPDAAQEARLEKGWRRIRRAGAGGGGVRRSGGPSASRAP
jgi:hypothetical protein